MTPPANPSSPYCNHQSPVKKPGVDWRAGSRGWVETTIRNVTAGTVRGRSDNVAQSAHAVGGGRP